MIATIGTTSSAAQRHGPKAAARLGRWSASTAITLFVLLVLPVAATLAARPAAKPADSASNSTAAKGVPIAQLPRPLLDRLAVLAPFDPQAYFELGEEIADLPGDRAHDEACRLFLLCADIAATRADAALTRSAYLALASLARSPEEKRWILAVRDAESPQPARQSTQAASAAAPAKARAAAAARAGGEDASYELALALGRYRAGDFRRTKESLRRVHDALARLVAAGMEIDRAQSILKQVTAESDGVGSCPRCHNERIVRNIIDGKPVIEPCPVCYGNPGPSPPLQADAFLEQLRAEALLLDVAPKSWADESLLDAGRPLKDVSFEALCAEFKVDPRKTVWRDGVWAVPAAR